MDVDIDSFALGNTIWWRLMTLVVVDHITRLIYIVRSWILTPRAYNTFGIRPGRVDQISPIILTTKSCVGYIAAVNYSAIPDP